MSQLPHDEKFELLAAGYFDEVLDEAGQAELKGLLHEDDQRVKRFAELAQLHQMIESEIAYRQQAEKFGLNLAPNVSGSAGALAELASLYEDDLQNPMNFATWREEQANKARADRFAVWRNRMMIGGGIAALIALVGVLAIVLSGGEVPEAPIAEQITDDQPAGPVEPIEPIQRTERIVATLTVANQALWATSSGNAAPAPGDTLHAGQRLTLTAGFAEITTRNGAIAILEAPATIELLDNNNALRLHTGKLVGICETDSSKGFVVRTPHTEVIDLGTRFGVHVEDAFSRPTHVQVFQGSVRMDSLAAETVTLFAGQARAAGAEGLVDASFDEARYAQSVTGRVQLAELAANPFGIANPSFEWVALEDGELSRKEVPGWILSNPKAAVVANPGQGVTLYYDPALALDANGGTVGDMHGRCLFFFSFDQTGASLSQTLATQAEVGTTYTLTVAIGDRMDKAVYRSDFAGYNIELLAGDQVLASLNASPDQSPGQGTFTDVTLKHTVQAGDPTGPLGIRLSTNRTADDQVTDFDNIRLTALRITGARRTD